MRFNSFPKAPCTTITNLLPPACSPNLCEPRKKVLGQSPLLCLEWMKDMFSLTRLVSAQLSSPCLSSYVFALADTQHKQLYGSSDHFIIYIFSARAVFCEKVTVLSKIILSLTKNVLQKTKQQHIYGKK